MEQVAAIRWKNRVTERSEERYQRLKRALRESLCSGIRRKTCDFSPVEGEAVRQDCGNENEAHKMEKIRR